LLHFRAGDTAGSQKKKVVNGNHVIQAFRSLSLKNYADLMEQYYTHLCNVSSLAEEDKLRVASQQLSTHDREGTNSCNKKRKSDSLESVVNGYNTIVSDDTGGSYNEEDENDEVDDDDDINRSHLFHCHKLQ
jgi:hypothetical protein